MTVWLAGSLLCSVTITKRWRILCPLPAVKTWCTARLSSSWTCALVSPVSAVSAVHCPGPPLPPPPPPTQEEPPLFSEGQGLSHPCSRARAPCVPAWCRGGRPFLQHTHPVVPGRMAHPLHVSPGLTLPCAWLRPEPGHSALSLLRY